MIDMKIAINALKKKRKINLNSVIIYSLSCCSKRRPFEYYGWKKVIRVCNDMWVSNRIFIFGWNFPLFVKKMHLYKCTALKKKDSVHVATANQTQMLWNNKDVYFPWGFTEKESGLSAFKMWKNLMFEEKQSTEATNILHIKYGCQSSSKCLCSYVNAYFDHLEHNSCVVTTKRPINLLIESTSTLRSTTVHCKKKYIWKMEKVLVILCTLKYGHVL